MKFFIDTADVEEIREAEQLGILDGVTTNPSLVAKTGRPHREVLEEICSIVSGPVSAEVISTTTDEMVAEARELATVASNIVIKAPLNRDGLRATRALTSDGIKVNVTLCFSANQALLAAKAGATYVSPFVGRLDDISEDGMELIHMVRQIYANYDYPTEIIVASIRHPVHVLQSALAGADIATIPFSVFDKLVNHPLTDIGLERFLADARKVPTA
jgi:transaldolase